MKLLRVRTWRSVFAFAVVFSFSLAVEAATVSKVSDDALNALRQPAKGERIRLESLLLDKSDSVVELEEFQLWAPGAKLVVHGANGTRMVDPPPTRFFRGGVAGDRESLAFLMLNPQTGAVEGLIATQNSRYALNAQPRRGAGPRDRAAFDEFLTEMDAEDVLAGERKFWACDVDRRMIDLPLLPEMTDRVAADAVGPVQANGVAAGQSYAITLEIQTDFELYQNAGNNETTLRNYVTALVGAMATIYKRDLNVDLTLGNTHVYTSSSDPWAATGSNGLDELTNYYHTTAACGGVCPTPNGARTTSAVALLSGKDFGGGVAWEGIIGANDGQFGDLTWFGPYSWNGGIGRLFGDTGLGSLPDPDATNGAGTLYGMPTGTQNFWPLAELAHELGHNLGGHHTHCIGVTDSERLASGFTDGSPANSTSNQVDHCYGAEGQASCFSGGSYTAGAQGIFKGTIMSYCHNVFSGTGVPQSRFVFGVESEPSNHQYTDYMLRAAGPIQTADGRDGGPTNIVQAISTFALTSVTAPGNVVPNSAGNVATMAVSTLSGTTFSWQITNGTITGGQGTASVTFTAGSSGAVSLRAIAFRSNRVGVSELKSIPITSAGPAAPTNVQALASSGTNVFVSWSGSDGATSYTVWRSQGDAYTNLGSPSPNPAATSFLDTTASPNSGYFYQVEAHNASGSSPLSGADIALTMVYTDPTITSGLGVKAVHLTQLRTAATIMMTMSGGAAPSWTDSTISPGVTLIKATHFQEVETVMRNVRGGQGLSVPPLLGIADGGPVLASHITALRSYAQ